jgi:hypothetical protein
VTDQREPLGRLVRDTWIAWAKEQPDPKDSWLVPWDDLDAGQREADMRIGEAVAAAVAERLDGSEPASEPPAGEYARVEIMGHDERTGWVTDGSLAGSACLDVRDDSGRLIAKIPPHSVYLYMPVLPPGAFRAGEVRALPGPAAGAPDDPWPLDDDDDEEPVL